MWCIVNLPNGTQQVAVQMDSKSIGHECLEKVCEALGIICEMEYFGLELWTPNDKQSRTHQWINLRNRLTIDGNGGIQLMLALRVKFWVPVHFILQESVRNLFYMQAKVDLLEERLNAKDWTNAAKLAALLCQADGIRFNPLSLKSKSLLNKNKAQSSQSQSHQNNCHCKDKKEKEHVLSLKKRRLSKQKSIENIENAHANVAPIPSSSTQTMHSGAGSNNTLSAAVCSDSVSIINSDAEDDCSFSPLHIYNDYIVRPSNDLGIEMPDDFLHQIAIEHGKLSVLKMTPKSAKYWLLQEIADLACYGEELFTGVTTSGETSIKCDAAVGAHGICITIGNDKRNIPFSAIAAAKSFRRVFKLEYVDDHNDRKELEIKLPKHAIAAGLYRSITERHAFYVCDKVRGVVTNQFTRDFKGTIASMFKEDTELGKRYVFDIQLTCREVHDQARRTLHERGIDVTTHSQVEDDFDGVLQNLRKSVFESASNDTSVASRKSNLKINSEFSMVKNLDLAIREKELRDAAIERCVDTRISEAMTCKICMDRAINTMFSPCCHVLACMQCATRCINCPNCRAEVTSVVKIFLPPELRISKYYAKEIDGSSLVVSTAA